MDKFKQNWKELLYEGLNSVIKLIAKIYNLFISGNIYVKSIIVILLTLLIFFVFEKLANFVVKLLISALIVVVIIVIIIGL